MNGSTGGREVGPPFPSIKSDFPLKKGYMCHKIKRPNLITARTLEPRAGKDLFNSRDLIKGVEKKDFVKRLPSHLAQSLGFCEVSSHNITFRLFEFYPPTQTEFNWCS